MHGKMELEEHSIAYLGKVAGFVYIVWYSQYCLYAIVHC